MKQNFHQKGNHFLLKKETFKKLYKASFHVVMLQSV